LSKAHYPHYLYILIEIRIKRLTKLKIQVFVQIACISISLGYIVRVCTFNDVRVFRFLNSLGSNKE